MPEPDWEIFWAYLLVLDNLEKDFGCSIVTNFMSAMFGFSTAFHCWVVIFYSFTILHSFSYIRVIIFISIIRFTYFFINLVASNSKSFFQTFYWLITPLFIKSNSFMIVFKDKFSELIDCQLIYSAIFRVYMIILGKQRKKIVLHKWVSIKEKRIWYKLINLGQFYMSKGSFSRRNPTH